MKPPTVYLRKEPTTDTEPLCHNKRDVVVYYDENATRCFCRIPWHYTQSKPDRRNRWITLNCYRWRVIWLPDLSA